MSVDEDVLCKRADAAAEYYEAVLAYLNPENQYTESRQHAMDEAERRLLAALRRAPVTSNLPASAYDLLGTEAGAALQANLREIDRTILR